MEKNLAVNDYEWKTTETKYDGEEMWSRCACSRFGEAKVHILPGNLSAIKTNNMHDLSQPKYFYDSTAFIKTAV